MSKVSFIALALMIAANAAFAEEEVPTPRGGGSPAPSTGNKPQLDWEEFKNACLNPESANAQRKSKWIKITCVDSQTNWQPVYVGTGKEPLKAAQTITGSVTSEKFTVDAVEKEVAATPRNTTCTYYKQKSWAISSDYNVKCEHIEKYEGSLIDYCKMRLSREEADRGGIAKMTEGQATGEISNPNNCTINGKAPTVEGNE